MNDIREQNEDWLPRNFNNSIANIVEGLESSFKTSPGLILTEVDLQCLLYKELYEILEHNIETEEAGIMGSPLHTEIKYYNSERRLSQTPDIVLLDPSQLNIGRNIYSSKKFQFCGSSIAIEIKFCRKKNGISPKDVRLYRGDVEKLIDIHNLHYSIGNDAFFFGYFIIFSKSSDKCSEFDAFINEYSSHPVIRIFYGNSVS